jgi:1-deoxy-D-xylulose-5-phosphate reductoisomerase
MRVIFPAALSHATQQNSPAKRVAVLGSTGSIGCNALDVIRHLGPPYHVAAISAHTQVDKLLGQAREQKPSAIGVGDGRAYDAAKSLFDDLDCNVYVGPDGLAEMVARDDVDVVVAAIVGAAGLKPVMSAIRAGKTIALANKESLVVAGAVVIPEAKRRGVRLLPVDSEHSAIFQAMHCGRLNEVRRVILTASGGPFRNASAEQMERATLKDALAHPTWNMGSKITIDSATMFNKALEIIEACWLFDVPPEKVEVVVHPESVVHSMVEFVDNSVIAQLSPPDMRLPIQYALTYPDRAPGVARRLDIQKAFSLNFQPPDFGQFPALRLAFEVARHKGSAMGAVLNAANEAAVAQFASGNIAFGMISRVVELTIRRHQSRDLTPSASLDDLLEADRWARETADAIVRRESHTLARPVVA